MRISRFFATKSAGASSAQLESLFSEEAKEQRALAVAARFGRGNVSLQDGRVLTVRHFHHRMDQYRKKVEEGSFFFAQ